MSLIDHDRHQNYPAIFLPLFVLAETETIKAWQFSCIEMLIRMAETEGGEIDCWNSNRIYRRSQAPFTSLALIVSCMQPASHREGRSTGSNITQVT